MRNFYEYLWLAFVLGLYFILVFSLFIFLGKVFPVLWGILKFLGTVMMGGAAIALILRWRRGKAF